MPRIEVFNECTGHKQGSKFTDCLRKKPSSKAWCSNCEQKMNGKNWSEKKLTAVDYQRLTGLASPYSSARWKKLREFVLRKCSHLCETCLRNGIYTNATQVDHIIPVYQRPDLFWDEDNLAGICNSCHAVKSKEEAKAARQ